MNKVIIIGNIAQAPELKTTPQGISVLAFTLVTNEYYKDSSGEKVSRAEYHNCVAWRGIAETIARYVQKGQKLAIEGKLQTRDWTDPSGVKKYKTEIIVNSMELLGQKSSGSDGQQSRPSGTTTSSASTAQQAYPENTGDDGSLDAINIDELPF